MKYAIWSARILLAAVFFYAGVIKLGTSERFAVTVARFSILPDTAANAFALSLGWIEAAAAILLVTPRTTRIGAALISALLVIFIAALGWSLGQGFVIDCGCFGEDPAPSGGKMVVAIWRDAALLALTLGLAWRRPR